MLPLDTEAPPFWITATAAAGLIFGILFQLIQLIRRMDVRPVVSIVLTLSAVCATSTFGIYWIMYLATN